MINLAVINLKNLIKKTIKIIIVTLIVAMIFNFIKMIRNIDITQKLNERILDSEKEIIQSSVAVLEDNKEKSDNTDIILASELSVFTSNGNTDYTVNLIASHDVQKSEFMIITIRISLVLIIIIVFGLIVRKVIKRK